MTPKEFWENDIDTFYAYEKAYITRLHQESHIQGLYVHCALETALSNAFAKNGAKRVEYPKEPIYSPYNEKYLHKKEIQSMDGKQRDEVHRKKMSFWNRLFSDKNKKKEGGNN